ncbi:MAG TPA: PadR family transcriptional regulator [Chromatiales bacterium]|nr:PadR family transcriptional regulator [Chromatiales bacterium]
MNVKTLCLGALSLGDHTGYDIKKLFESAFNHFYNASFGSIYPALHALQEEGFVECQVEAGERRPDRKLFSITDAGREALIAEITRAPPIEHFRSAFLVLMFFAHLLPTERLRELLDEVEANHEQELAYLESIWHSPKHSAGVDFTIEHGIAVHRAALEQIRGRREELLAHHRDIPEARREAAP